MKKKGIRFDPSEPISPFPQEPEEEHASKKTVELKQVPFRERSEIEKRYLGESKKSWRNVTSAHNENWNLKEDTFEGTQSSYIKMSIADDSLDRPSNHKKYEVHRSWREMLPSEWTNREIRIWRAENEISITSKEKIISTPILSWSPTLPDSIVSALMNLGYNKPLPIQSQCIPLILANNDIIGLSQPGTGKTLAYVIPLINYILSLPPSSPSDGALAIVLVPTHELAEQINSVISSIATPLGIRSKSFVGGLSIQDQAIELNKVIHVIVATPGRLVDILDSHLAVLGQCKYVVLDEADKMVDESFGPQIDRIFKSVSSNCGIFMFSATMPNAVLPIVEKYFKNVVTVRSGTIGEASSNITQIVLFVDKSKRKQAFLEQIHTMKSPIIVFTNSRSSCEDINNVLSMNGFKVAFIHGGKGQKERETVFGALQDGIIDVIVATDVLSRGIDIGNVENVVNFEVPSDISTYVHRIGRTGRAGAKGTATSFVTAEDKEIMYDLRVMLQRNNFAVPEAMMEQPAAQTKVATIGERKYDA